MITIDLKLNNQLISLVLLNNLEQPPLEPHTLESFTIGCNPLQNSTNHGTIKLSPTVQAALKPRQVPSATKEDLWRLAKKRVTTLICKTFPLLVLQEAYSARCQDFTFSCSSQHIMRTINEAAHKSEISTV